MSTVLFIRHAETDMAGRFCGQSDPELNEPGRAHLAALVQELSSRPIAVMYSSDLRRAQSTAQAIAGSRGLSVVLRPALREIYFGDWEGLSWEQIEHRDAAFARKWAEEFPRIAAPGGETFDDFEARVFAEASSLIEEQRGPIAIVTHAGVLRVVLQRLAHCSEAEAWERTRNYGCIFDYDFETTGANK